MSRLREILEALSRYEQNKELLELIYAKKHLDKLIIEKGANKWLKQKE